MSQHTAATVALARSMHDGGWSVVEIQRYLQSQGATVAYSTVYGWLHDAYAERRRESDRVRGRRHRQDGGRLGLPRHSDELRLERMAGLREAGLSFGAVAKAMNFDWPAADPLNEHRVRYLLGRAA